MPDTPTNGPRPTEPPRTMQAFAATRDWPGYFALAAGRPPRETLLDALQRFEAEGVPDASQEPPLAVDLGCGEGRDSAELLRRGWKVIAIDGHPEAIDRLLARDDLTRADRLETRLEAFAEARIPPCDLLNASFALPFCEPDHFAGLWTRIRASLRPGARFAGQLFGERDSWATIPDRSHQTRDEALALLDGLELERFDEEERNGEDASGAAKHWHVFHVVARNPGNRPPNEASR